MTRPRRHRPFALLAVTALLLLAAAGNVLAEGVHASSVQLYAGLPGLGGRLVDRANRRRPESGPEPRVLITTLENAPTLRLSWAAAERAGAALDPGAERFVPHGAVVLSETHSEGRVHTALVHPDDVDARIPAHPSAPHAGEPMRPGGPETSHAPWGPPGAATGAGDNARRDGGETEGSRSAPASRAAFSAVAGPGRRSGRGVPLRTPGSRARRRTTAAQGARG